MELLHLPFWIPLGLVMDDAQEAFGLQASAPYQGPVNVRLTHQVPDVFRLDTPTVQNANRGCCLLSKVFSEPMADCGMDFLGNFGRRCTSSSNRPDRFVGENDTQKVGGCQAIETACKLLTDYLLNPFRLPLSQSLPHTDDRLRGGLDDRADTLVHGLVGFTKELSPFRVSQDDHVAPHIFEPGHAYFSGEGPVSLPMHILPGEHQSGASNLGRYRRKNGIRRSQHHLAVRGIPGADLYGACQRAGLLGR